MGEWERAGNGEGVVSILFARNFTRGGVAPEDLNTHTHILEYIYICMYAYTYSCMHIQMHVCINIYIHAYTYACIHIHTYTGNIHTNTHT